MKSKYKFNANNGIISSVIVPRFNWLKSYKTYKEKTIEPIPANANIPVEVSGLKRLNTPTKINANKATNKKFAKNDRSLFVLAPMIPNTKKTPNVVPNAIRTTWAPATVA